MSMGVKFEFIEEFNKITLLARDGRDDFTDEVCNFLVNHFDLQATVLFKVEGEKNLSVLGKSNSARKNYLKGSVFNCSHCKVFENNSNYALYSDSSCELQISEFLVYECCIYFTIDTETKAFLKLARKNPFTQTDKAEWSKITEYLKFILNMWLSARGGSTLLSERPFSELVNDSAQALRNPSNNIIGFTTILGDENLTSSQSEYVTTIKRNAQALLLLINDLSDLSKMESGKLQQTNKQINIEETLKEITGIFKNKPEFNEIDFKLDIDKGVPPAIDIDDQKLRYIFNNLFTIATSFTKKGLLEIRVARVSANLLQFSIDGIKKEFSPEQEKTLFDAFEISKFDELKDKNITGLGLKLVKKYINLLGGTIAVKSSKGKGTSFEFTINGELMSELEVNISKLPTASPTHNKILVIEDDYATSKLLSNYLNKWGYDPTIVNSEEQTFALLDKEHFLAVILDIELPGVNGLAFLKKIHEHPKAKQTPVIVCSVEADQQKAYLMGAVEYFVKPINYNFLVEVLTSYKLRKNSNILCVDDDVPTLNLVKQAIETAGFKAIAENVSAKVMDLIKGKEIDMAIIDLEMPDPNGFELIKLIKSDPEFAKVPIMIYTGKENYAEDLQQIEGLFEELLDKRSTNIEDLGSIIDGMINRYETPPPVEEVIEKKDVIKILLAEDYKHSQIIVTRLLKKNTFENIVVVENGEDAYKMAQQEDFDLILMDMQMPIMNGFEATEKIRQIDKYKDIPIIALTAFAMKGDREKCLEAGATDYIPKPIDSKEFIEKVKYYTNAGK